jgi:hypothetical protein
MRHPLLLSAAIRERLKFSTIYQRWSVSNVAINLSASGISSPEHFR